MQKVLRKRVLRNLRRHMGRYFALCLLVILGVFIVVSLLGAAQNIIDGTAEFAQTESGKLLFRSDRSSCANWPVKALKWKSSFISIFLKAENRSETLQQAMVLRKTIAPQQAMVPQQAMIPGSQ